LGRNLNGKHAVLRPYLRVANVKDGHIDLQDVIETPVTVQEASKLALHDGDLLLTEGGDRDKLGRGAVWRAQIPGCVHQNHIFRVRVDRTIADPDFVSFQTGSSYGKAYFLRHAKQTTGIASINQRVLGSLPLMLPAITEQKRIAAVLLTQVERQQRLAERVRTQAATIMSMVPALLRNGSVE
jgi:type I restriction enzyme S subunit